MTLRDAGNDGMGLGTQPGVAPLCGYCLEVSMTGRPDPPLWFPAYAGMTVRDAGNDCMG